MRTWINLKKKRMNRLFDLNKRDKIGLVCWFVAGFWLNLLAIPFMVTREVYQWKHYHLARFEWEDVVRYSVVIAFGSIIQTLFLAMLGFNL